MNQTYKDRDGKEINALKYAELLYNPKYTLIASEQIGSLIVCTEWKGLCDIETGAFFETTVCDPSGNCPEIVYKRFLYSSEDEAKKGHKKLVQEIENLKIKEQNN